VAWVENPSALKGKKGRVDTVAIPQICRIAAIIRIIQRRLRAREARIRLKKLGSGRLAQSRNDKRQTQSFAFFLCVFAALRAMCFRLVQHKT
jgi:hypothetical protein